MLESGFTSPVSRDRSLGPLERKRKSYSSFMVPAYTASGKALNASLFLGKVADKRL
jgi:hypothetical protein